MSAPNWSKVGPALVVSECSSGNIEYLLCDAKARIADLTAQRAKLLEALEWLEGYLRETPHHNAPAAANARAAIARAKGGSDA